MFDMDFWMNLSSVQVVYISVAVIMFLLSRLLLGLAVYDDGKLNKYKYRILWGILSFLFGYIFAIIYAIVVFAKYKGKHRISSSILIIFAIAAMFISSFSFFVYELSNTGEFGFLDFEINFTYNDVTYRNRFGRKVILDKEGNEYTYSKRQELLYYTENGEKYKNADKAEYFYTKYMNIETGEYYTIVDYDFYVNDEGYFCVINKDDNNLKYCADENYRIYYDDNHFYYTMNSVYWDRNGNLVFPNYAEERYQKILEKIEKIN